jgi:alkanesulfonate monooxygenase SsuD/methylene tetrahydromethanopterin reductase-like flavin-dependent oxidoreductase (luciferase family)
MTEGRFELGIGTGRPGIEDELRERGLPVTSPAERLTQVRDTVAQLRELDGPKTRTPVVMAVRGPKAQALAGEVADTVTFVLGPLDTRDDVADLVRGFPGGRDVELALHVPVVGDGIANFMASARETHPAQLREADSMLVLPDDPAAAIEELERRRAELGFSYVVIGADFADTMAPVVGALAGR